MTSRSALTPEGALGWLRSLSIDVISAAVLDADGKVLAGDPGLARTAGGPTPPPAARSGPATPVLIARSERFAIAVRPGPKAIERLLRADMGSALAALERG
jgi:hypothetical protein